MSINNWMSWEAGVDLVAATSASLKEPNVILHVARLVHTPVGAAASGMVMYAPEAGKPPVIAGFVSADEKLAKFFGPRIFAGTPFEHAPALKADIQVRTDRPGEVSSRIAVAGFVFEVTLSGLEPAELVHRAPAAMTPFWQQGVEAAAAKATLKVNGKDVAIVVPQVGISGGAAAVFAATGIYAR